MEQDSVEFIRAFQKSSSSLGSGEELLLLFQVLEMEKFHPMKELEAFVVARIKCMTVSRVKILSCQQKELLPAQQATKCGSDPLS